MNFTPRITQIPRVFSQDIGQDTAALFPNEMRPLIIGTASTSLYLNGLMLSEADWLNASFDEPEAAIDAVISSLREVPLDALGAEMRRAKRRIAVLTGLGDLGGVFRLSTVTEALTRLADACVDCALKKLVGAEIKRGKLPGMSEADIGDAGGMFVLAMGKMGAFELNYSSDIDLICLFDETRFDPDTYHDARASFVRVTRRLTKLIGDVTRDGYVFRTDLRLRPDASVTPVCLSSEAAERYYESVGRTWERAAFIKARVCAGDRRAGQNFLDVLIPFVWRKHLDFAAIRDAHDMRLRIRSHKGLHGPITLPDHNMKLGRGGIREIEFFTQTRQLISGGRDPSLRVRKTGEGLARLTQSGWIKPDVSETLWDHYQFHRMVEHRLQMVADGQTHTLPKDDHGFARIAAMMDRDVVDLKQDITTRLKEVHQLTEGFFAPQDPVTSGREPDFGADIIERWQNYPALRSDRAIAIFESLRPEIIGRLQKATRPEEALVKFDGFLAGLPAGVQLFSLFESNPQLVDLVIDICSTAPALARYLARNSDVFDAVIGGEFFSAWPGKDGLFDALSKTLDEAQDYEAQLDSARRWKKEWHFRIGVHTLRGLITAEEAGVQYGDLAEAVIIALWPAVEANFSTTHGSPPGTGAAIVGMGSLGAGRLHAMSDLDLIVIYDPGDVEMSDGRRSLATRPYYARLTQALVTALSAPTAEGRLYEVDMRLRPSGRQGPIATALQSFRDYQLNEAWTWEHLALTRARALTGPKGLCREIETFRGELLAEKKLTPGIPKDVSEMRNRIAEAKAPAGHWDAKIGTGRLQDIELFSQSIDLRLGGASLQTHKQIEAGVAAGLIEAADARALILAAEMLWAMQISARLLTEGPLDLEEIGLGGCQFLLRTHKVATVDVLRECFTSAVEASARAIDAGLKRAN